MAIKKQVTGKPGKAAVKPAVKNVVKNVVAQPKKVAKPAAVKKVTVIKPAAKPAAKKVAAPVIKPVAKPAAKKVAAPVARPVIVKKGNKLIEVPKKSIPVAKAIIPINKENNSQKLNVKPAVKAPEKAVKSANQPMSKKVEGIKAEEKKVEEKKVERKAVTSRPAVEVKVKEIKVSAPKPVAIPKITTKTVRKYQPDFTKSVLDKVAVQTQGPTLRYSDAELVEFRELIQRKLMAAKKELSYLHGLITRKDEMGGDEGDNRYMTMEDGSLSMEREQISQMASRQITFIDHLEKAVMRIENKTYGICRVTGKLIDKARLRAVPHATLSIEAKMISSK